MQRLPGVIVAALIFVSSSVFVAEAAKPTEPGAPEDHPGWEDHPGEGGGKGLTDFPGGDKADPPHLVSP